MRPFSALRCVAVVALIALPCILSSCAVTSDVSGSVSGRVMSRETSMPVSGAWVQCEGMVDQTDDQGNYLLGGISKGDRIVTATADGYEDFSAIVSIGESTQYDILMDVYYPPASLSGHVTHSVLGPIEGAIVQLGDQTVTTDENGFYEYPNVQQVTYHMTVTKEGYRTFSGNVHVGSTDFVYDVGLKKLATVVLAPDADAWVDAFAPTANFGSDTVLKLLFSNSRHYRFFIRFPMDLEETATAVSAMLRMYNTYEYDLGETRTIQVAPCLSPWNEETITWNNSPSTADPSTAASTYTPPWVDIDVTYVFSYWLGGGHQNYGFLVDSSQDLLNAYYLASREYPVEDARPSVTLEYAW
jgi:hypothetical protein